MHLLLTVLLAAAVASEGEPAVFIDGRFDEWTTVAAFEDPRDAPSGELDIRRIRLAHDAEAVYLLLEYEEDVLPQGLDGTAMLLLDADGDSSTGGTEYDLTGVDLVVVFSPPNPRWSTGARGVGLRSVGSAGDPRGERLTTYALDLIGAPTHASSRYEARLERGRKLPGTGELFVSDSVRGLFVHIDPEGEIVDRSEPFDYLLTTPFGDTTDEPAPTDPLARTPGTDFRLLSWNVSAESIYQESERFRRIFDAVRPDVLLFDEAPADATADAVLALVEHLPVPQGHAWRTVIGRGGGRQHAVVTSHYPVEALPTLERVPYPDDFPEYLAHIDRPEIQSDLRDAADDGVSTAGMVVDLGGRRLLAMPLDLQCCGRVGEPEERIRQIQAQAIRDALLVAVPDAALDGLIVAGDLNLVGTRRPLDLLTEGLDLDGSDLAIVEAPQLDGRSTATWGFGGWFPSSRLDYVFYGDSTLEALSAFVFDVRDLDSHWRSEHGVVPEDVRASGHLPVVVDFRWTEPLSDN